MLIRIWAAFLNADPCGSRSKTLTRVYCSVAGAVTTSGKSGSGNNMYTMYYKVTNMNWYHNICTASGNNICCVNPSDNISTPKLEQNFRKKLYKKIRVETRSKLAQLGIFCYQASTRQEHLAKIVFFSVFLKNYFQPCTYYIVYPLWELIINVFTMTVSVSVAEPEPMEQKLFWDLEQEPEPKQIWINIFCSQFWGC